MFNLKLVLDGSVTERILKHPADLFEFTLDGEKRASLNDYSNLSTNFNRLLWRYKRIRQITNRNQSPILSWDLDYQKLANGGTLRGFFQGEEALGVLENNKRSRFELTNPSENFNTMSQVFKKKSITSIHVRRGDYRNYVDNFGLLSPKYYAHVLLESKVANDSGEIWLFSDEPELALQLFESEPNLSIRVINDTGITSAGLLEIMSLGKAYVIANSTFSWWAAYKSKSRHVVAPKQWFKSATGPSRLFPAHWHLTSSHFE
jgi:hypothetical protein